MKKILQIALFSLFHAAVTQSGCQIAMSLQSDVYHLDSDGNRINVPHYQRIADHLILTPRYAVPLLPSLLISIPFAFYLRKKQEKIGDFKATIVALFGGSFVGTIISFLIYLWVGGWGPPLLYGYMTMVVSACFFVVIQKRAAFIKSCLLYSLFLVLFEAVDFARRTQ